jgi:hypothetical protein
MIREFAGLGVIDEGEQCLVVSRHVMVQDR